MILLIEEILHQLVGSLSHCLQGFSTIPGGCLGFLNHQLYNMSDIFRKIGGGFFVWCHPHRDQWPDFVVPLWRPTRTPHEHIGRKIHLILMVFTKEKMRTFGTNQLCSFGELHLSPVADSSTSVSLFWEP